MTGITLAPLATDDREQFIRDNQEAFNYAKSPASCIEAGLYLFIHHQFL